jgi:hypothetical protein
MLLKKELEQLRAIRAVASRISRDSDLEGIGAGGRSKKPELAPNGDLKAGGYLLLFAVHRKNVEAEVRFWNGVIALEPNGSAHAPIQYWGVCDAGSSCDPYQPVAQFSILGYLDPYQMRILVNADDRHEALLYDRSLWLQARVPTQGDSSAVSETIRQKVK